MGLKIVLFILQLFQLAGESFKFQPQLKFLLFGRCFLLASFDFFNLFHQLGNLLVGGVPQLVPGLPQLLLCIILLLGPILFPLPVVDLPLKVHEDRLFLLP